MLNFLPVPAPNLARLGPRPSPVEFRGDAGETGLGLGTRPGLVLCRASEALEVVAGRGWLGEWVAKRGWGPRLEAERDGVVAVEACRQRSENHLEGRDCGIRDGKERRDWRWREER